MVRSVSSSRLACSSSTVVTSSSPPDGQAGHRVGPGVAGELVHRQAEDADDAAHDRGGVVEDEPCAPRLLEVWRRPFQNPRRPTAGDVRMGLAAACSVQTSATTITASTT